MIRDGDFTIYKNSTINEFHYKIIQRKSMDEMKKECIEDKKCLGFDTSGRLYFYVPLDIIKKQQPNDSPNDIYFYRTRQAEYEIRSDEKKGSIPKLIHYIWFSQGRPFNIVNYIAIKTALKHCPSYKIYIHCDSPPEKNIYYDHLKDKIETNIIDVVSNLNGNQVYYFQHKADVSRLRILKEMGGIYLDLDILLLKPLDQYLDKRFVIGYENAGNASQTNAVVMVEPNNDMINEWIDIYNVSWGTISPIDGNPIIGDWMGHSVILPYQLSYKYGYMMSVQNNKAFYPFLWTDYSIFYDEDNNKNYEDSTCIHLWDTELYKTNLPPTNPYYFKRMNNAFTRLFKDYVEDIPLTNKYHSHDFIEFKGYDMPEHDIKCSGRIEIGEMIWMCNEIPDCIGFNTLGFFKKQFDKEKLIPTKGRPYCCDDDSFYLLNKSTQ